MNGSRIITLSIFLCLLMSGSLSAQILHYVDDSGRRIYVDHITKVPPEYRDQLEVRGSRMTPQQQAELEQQRLERMDRQQLQQQLREVDQAIDASRTQVNIRGNSVLVPVRVQLGGRTVPLNLVLDTGATQTVIHRQSLDRLRIDARRAGYAQIASGDIIETYSARLDRIEIGPYTLNGPRAGIIDFQGNATHDGLLGMDFLRQIDYRIDFENDQVIWDPSRLASLQTTRTEIEEAIQALAQQD